MISVDRRQCKKHAFISNHFIFTLTSVPKGVYVAIWPKITINACVNVKSYIIEC